jgi:hypothetical protein
MPVARRLASRETVEAVRSLHLHVETGGKAVPLPVVGAFHVVEPLPDVESSFPAISRAPYGPPEKCYGHLPLDHPGRIVGTSGAGTVVVMPWTVGRGYREVGLSAFRDLFIDSLLEVVPHVAFPTNDTTSIPLPEAVEVVTGSSRAGQVIHLINRSGDADQRFRQPVTIRGAALNIDSRVSRVTALRAGVDLPIERFNGMAEVRLPDLDLFEVLLVEEIPPA